MGLFLVFWFGCSFFSDFFVGFGFFLVVVVVVIAIGLLVCIVNVIIKPWHNEAFPLHSLISILNKGFHSWEMNIWFGTVLCIYYLKVPILFPLFLVFSVLLAWIVLAVSAYSSAIWVTMYSKNTKLQYIPKSTFWPKWRSESTDLGTVLQKRAKFVFWQ